MAYLFKIRYKQDGDRKLIAETSIKAPNATSAKMKFVDQGYGTMMDIIEISES